MGVSTLLSGRGQFIFFGPGIDENMNIQWASAKNTQEKSQISRGFVLLSRNFQEFPGRGIRTNPLGTPFDGWALTGGNSMSSWILADPSTAFFIYS